MSKLSLIDRTLLAFSPGWAASRARGRREFHQHRVAADVLRKYEAASTGRRNKGWQRPGTSANAEVSSSASLVRNGARQLVRDNGHAANAVNVLENNVIGTGIRPDFLAATDATTRMFDELWEQHLEEEASGAEGCGDFYSRQGLGFRAVVESGSVLARRRRRSDGVLPYQVQMMEPDFLDTTITQHNGNDVIQGKEYNRRGDLLAYHIFKAHPGDSFIGYRTTSGSIRVLARDMAHAYRMDRPGQVDGVSWFSPVMTTLRELADTRDSYQLRQKLAACYVAFIHDPDGTGTPGESGNNAALPTHMEPGRMEALPPGKQVTFASPPGVDGMSDFDRAQLLTIAVGLGMPYEALTGDLRNVNFLSGRMGWLAFYRNIDSWRTKVVIPRQCKPELQWFVEAIAAAKGIREPIRVSWICPHRDLIDPTQEIKALREEMRLGGLAYPDMVKMRGRDPNRVIEAWEKWDKDLKKRNLYFDWDPRKVSMAGNANKETTTEEADDA